MYLLSESHKWKCVFLYIIWHSKEKLTLHSHTKEMPQQYDTLIHTLWTSECFHMMEVWMTTTRPHHSGHRWRLWDRLSWFPLMWCFQPSSFPSGRQLSVCPAARNEQQCSLIMYQSVNSVTSLYFKGIHTICMFNKTIFMVFMHCNTTWKF